MISLWNLFPIENRDFFDKSLKIGLWVFERYFSDIFILSDTDLFSHEDLLFSSTVDVFTRVFESKSAEPSSTELGARKSNFPLLSCELRPGETRASYESLLRKVVEPEKGTIRRILVAEFICSTSGRGSEESFLLAKSGAVKAIVQIGDITTEGELEMLCPLLAAGLKGVAAGGERCLKYISETQGDPDACCHCEKVRTWSG